MMRVRASELNVRSGPGTGFRVVGSLTRGTSVTVVETSGEWVWVENAAGTAGWVSSSWLEPTGAPSAAPKGLAGIEEAFGPPGGPEASAGRVRFPVPLRLSWVDQRVGSFSCHALVAAPFQRVFDRIYAEGLWHHLETFGGCYNFRKISGSSKYSTHAWGIAVDLNAHLPKNQVKIPPRIVAIFEDEGFTWGGDWKGASFDPMHFQYASGY